jgi:hypothetical protein
MSRRRIVLVALVGATVVAPVACYGPTELTVVISTDLGCEPSPTIAIYKGLPFDGIPLAVTDQCKRGDHGAEIGSLVFVPSADREGRASVKVVLARGQDPSQCDAHPEACVVATRSFSFVKHASRRLPIQLLGECVGKVCADGLTCGRGGVCVSDAVVCASGECTLPAEEPPVSAVGDSGAAADAAPSPPCAGPNGDGTLVTVAGGMPRGAAAGDGRFFYVEASPNVPVVWAVNTAGDRSSVFTPGESGWSLIALRTSGNLWGALYERSFGPATKVMLMSSRGKFDLDNPVSDAYTDVAGSPDTLTLYLARTQSVRQILPSDGGPDRLSVLNAQIGGARIAVDGNAVYVASAEKISVLSPATGEVLHEQDLGADGSNPVAFAQHAGTVLAFANMCAGARCIVVFDANASGGVRVLAAPSAAIVSLAADAKRVYYTDGHTLWRAPIAPSTASPGQGLTNEVVFTTADETLDHLAVSSACVYFWSQSADATRASLRGIPKLP